MFSIKKSFADCSSCPLLHALSCITETNCERDLKKVECVYIAENPAGAEVERVKPVPLVGKAGKTFRNPFNDLKLNKLPYLITNCVLCQTIAKDGKTGNPTDDVIERCKINCMELINICEPKLIVLMGNSPAKAFGFNKPITELRGKFYKWNEYDVFITVHPQYVNYNLATEKPLFEEDFKLVKSFLMTEKQDIIYQLDIGYTGSNSKLTVEGNGIYRYKIPEKFYTDEFRLVDVQLLKKNNEILYIFRDKENKKVYHRTSNKYVFYRAKDSNQSLLKILPFSDLESISMNYSDVQGLSKELYYESDIHPSVKHAMDYYHFNKGECDRIENNVFFADIETDTGVDNKAFPIPEKAEYPINLITVSYNGKITCYVLDNKTEEIKDRPDIDLKIFKKEKDLVSHFIKDFRDSDPDFTSGWHYIGFDLQYIFNRMKKLKMNPESISNFSETYIFADNQNAICHIAGCVALDQLQLYKTFSQGGRENYKLDTIAELEIGKQKVKLSHPINEMYWKALNEMIDYNIQDTVLLVELENKLKHIELLDEIRKACNTSFHAGKNVFGQIDSLVVSFLREKDLASKTALQTKKEKYKGAFVLEPIPGVYNHVADLDFASLYPSNILTYNIGIETFYMKFKDKSLGYDILYQKDKLPEKIKVIIDPINNPIEKEITSDELFKIIEDEKLIFTVNGCFFRKHEVQKSNYGKILDLLIDQRKTYKNMMLDYKEKGDTSKSNYYNTRQLTYKVIANSLYGVIAKEIFRFFNLDCAEAITLSGQEALKNAIIEGNAYMHFLRTKKHLDYKPLKKSEMFSDTMNRKTDYIITGDTDSIFICFEKFKPETTDSKEKILDMCVHLQSYLNNEVISNIVKSRNVNPENNRLSLKNELLMSRGFFLAKKRYALQVISQEGKDIDEMVSMGLETKRSDYPSMSKEFLNELLHQILYSEKISLIKLRQFIDFKQKEFIEQIQKGSKTIARPIAYTKDIEDYKTLSQNIKAITAFNEIVYDGFTVGDRGYLFRIKGIDFDKAPKDVILRFEEYIKKGNKLDAIAIPDEEEKLPDYFVVDVKGNLQFSFIDRYELLLEPLMKLQNNVQDGTSFKMV